MQKQISNTKENLGQAFVRCLKSADKGK